MLCTNACLQKTIPPARLRRNGGGGTWQLTASSNAKVTCKWPASDMQVQWCQNPSSDYKKYGVRFGVSISENCEMYFEVVKFWLARRPLFQTDFPDARHSYSENLRRRCCSRERPFHFENMIQDCAFLSGANSHVSPAPSAQKERARGENVISRSYMPRFCFPSPGITSCLPIRENQDLSIHVFPIQVR